MNKLKTWWRIQKRMAVIHLAEAYVFLEWPLRLIVNWLFFFSAPLWVGPFYMIGILKKSWSEKKSQERAALSGRIWWWSQYDLY